MTTTSNLHIGLSAWQSSHAYNSLGTRVSNGGNAYQLIGTGTSASSGGPSGVSSSITDGTARWKFLSSVDFTTIAAWVAAIPATLTQPIIGALWNDAPITTTTGAPFLTLTGHTTTSVNTITLTCAAGESFRDTLAGGTTALAFNTANGVSFVCPAGISGINFFDIGDSNVILDGIQVQDPTSTSGSTIFGARTGTNLILRNFICDGFAQTGGAFMIDIFSGGVGSIYNGLIIDRQGTTDGVDAVSVNPTTTCDIVNCTIISTNNSTTGAAFSSGSAGTIVKNCAVFGYTIPATGSPAIAIDHSVFSATNVGTGGTNGAGNLFSKTAANQFVSSTVDFRLKVGSSCIDTGTTDTTDVVSSDDIGKNHRPFGSAWDIGCWEFTASGQVPLNLALDPPSLNTVLIVEPFPGPVSNVLSSNITNTSVALTWAAPTIVTPTNILVDAQVVSNIPATAISNINFKTIGITASGTLASALIDLPFQIGSTNGVALSSSSIQVNWVGASNFGVVANIILANGGQSTDSIFVLSTNASATSATKVFGINSVPGVSAVGQLGNIVHTITARNTLFSINSSVSVVIKRQVSGTATLPQITSASSVSIFNIASEISSFNRFSAIGLGLNANGVFAKDNVLTISAVSHAQQNESRQYFLIRCAASVAQSVRVSGSASINLTATSNVILSNGVSVTDSFFVLSSSVLIKQFDLAQASNTLFNITSSVSVANQSSHGISTLSLSASVSMVEELHVSARIPFFPLNTITQTFPFIVVDGINLKLAADGSGRPPLNLSADIIQTDVFQFVDASVQQIITSISAVISSALLNGASLVSTIASLSSNTNAILQDNANTTQSINFTAAAFAQQQAMLSFNTLGWQVVATLAQRRPAQGLATLRLLIPSIQGTLSNKWTSTDTIHITARSQAVQQDFASATNSCLVISGVNHAVWGDAISAANAINFAVVGRSDQRYAAAGSGTFQYRCASTMLQKSSMSAAVAIKIKTVAQIKLQDLASATSSIVIGNHATAKNTLNASAVNTIEPITATVTGTVVPFTPASARNTIMPFVCSATGLVQPPRNARARLTIAPISVSSTGLVQPARVARRVSNTIMVLSAVGTAQINPLPTVRAFVTFGRITASVAMALVPLPLVTVRNTIMPVTASVAVTVTTIDPAHARATVMPMTASAAVTLRALPLVTARNIILPLTATSSVTVVAFDSASARHTIMPITTTSNMTVVVFNSASARRTIMPITVSVNVVVQAPRTVTIRRSIMTMACSASASLTTAGVAHTVNCKIEPLACSATASVNGSAVIGKATMGRMLTSSSIGQNNRANSLKSINITLSPNAELFVTPLGFVEGDNIVFWVE